MANVVQQVLHATKTAAISAFQTVVSSSSEYVKPSVDAVVAVPTSPAAKNVLGDYVQPHIEPVFAKVHEVSLQVWEGGPGFGFNGTGLKEILKTALDYITPALEYIEKHPWVLIPLLIPALDAWLFYVGFRAAGIAAGSIAAGLQSRIGSVPKGSIFAFLQSNGAGGFARTAMRIAGVSLVLAVALAAIGLILAQHGIGEEQVVKTLDKAWNKHAARPTTPPTIGAPTGGAGASFTGIGLGWWGIWVAAWMWLSAGLY